MMAIIIPGISGGGISNGYVIEGVAHIVDSVAPSTRPDGSALVAGDKWYDPTTGNTAFRYGTRWLSTERLSLDFVAASLISATGNSNIDKRLPVDSFIDGWGLSLDAISTHDISNYFTLSFYLAQAATGTAFINSSLVRSPYWDSNTNGDIVYTAGPTDTSIVSNIPFGAFPNPTPNASAAARATFVWTEVGTTANVHYGFNLWYRRILG